MPEGGFQPRFQNEHKTYINFPLCFQPVGIFPHRRTGGKGRETH